MAHINKELDFVVTGFLIHPSEPKILLIHHKTLDSWLAPGGHVELGEDTDQALFRELKEETGLEYPEGYYVLQDPDYKTRWKEWSSFKCAHNPRVLLTPWAVEVHDFPPLPGHRHLALCYLCKALTAEVRLEGEAHHGIQWFSMAEMQDLKPKLLPTIENYSRRAIYQVWGRL